MCGTLVSVLVISIMWSSYRLYQRLTDLCDHQCMSARVLSVHSLGIESGMLITCCAMSVSMVL